MVQKSSLQPDVVTVTAIIDADAWSSGMLKAHKANDALQCLREEYQEGRTKTSPNILTEDI